MARALMLAAVLAACGGSKRAAPDAEAICAGTQKSRDAIVLRITDPADGGRARGVRELASRTASQNGVALAELDRFQSASDAAAIFTAHAEERDRKLREDLGLAGAIVPTMQTAIPAVILDEIERFPVSLAGATSVTPEAAELLKPLQDGSAQRAVADRAKGLATAVNDLARKLAALETQTDLAATTAAITEAMKIANVAHGKLNEAVATLHTHVVTVAALSDEQGSRAYAARARLWTRLTAITARLADPWPPSVLTARTRAFQIAGPRQWVVTCSAPRSLVTPAPIVAAMPVITGARDALAISLGYQPAPPSSVAAPTLAALRAALDAAYTP